MEIQIETRIQIQCTNTSGACIRRTH